ncbi:MAG: hypothetical protein IJG80_04900, partial [Selenomonadaceae bacterium]|nr:hypothetical protein [Selenomonadaceae bacterium]
MIVQFFSGTVYSKKISASTAEKLLNRFSMFECFAFIGLKKYFLSVEPYFSFACPKEKGPSQGRLLARDSYVKTTRGVMVPAEFASRSLRGRGRPSGTASKFRGAFEISFD